MGTNALKKGIYHKIQLFDNIYLFRGVKKFLNETNFIGNKMKR